MTSVAPPKREPILGQIRTSLGGKPQYYELPGKSEQRDSEKATDEEQHHDHRAIKIELDDGLSKEEVVDVLFRSISLTPSSEPSLQQILVLANPRAGSQNAAKFVKNYTSVEIIVEPADNAQLQKQDGKSARCHVTVFDVTMNKTEIHETIKKLLLGMLLISIKCRWSGQDYSCSDGR